MPQSPAQARVERIWFAIVTPHPVAHRLHRSSRIGSTGALVQSQMRRFECGIIIGMPKAIFLRPLTAGERGALESGVRSSDAFRMRRCQMLLANARRETAGQIGQHLSCSDQTVRNAIRAFNEKGVASLQAGPFSPPPLLRAF